jgi:hypothetical protein
VVQLESNGRRRHEALVRATLPYKYLLLHTVPRVGLPLYPFTTIILGRWHVPPSKVLAATKLPAGLRVTTGIKPSPTNITNAVPAVSAPPNSLSTHVGGL